MPTAAQTRARSRNSVLNAIDVPADSPNPNIQPPSLDDDEDDETDEEEDEEGDEDEDDEDGVPGTAESSRRTYRVLTILIEEEEEPEEPEVFPPPGLKEISSLASWTVSTAKPGNGVAALRSPDPTHFWQSDGPQPHLLSIHFFKLVSIVSIQILLNFQDDESYTPTKIQFLAGMGVHDIQDFAEMTLDQPNGWHDVDFSGVGPIEQEDEENDGAEDVIDWSKRPVLRSFLLQVRILENHQNGKDTHLRGVRVFARDETQRARQTLPETKSVALPTAANFKRRAKHTEPNNINMASWMMEPDLR